MGFSYPLKFLIVIVSVSILFVLPVNSTSRKAIKRSRGFQVSLRHVDSGGNLTKLERLQRAMKRGRHRLHRLSVLTAAEAGTVEDADVKSQIHSGSGEFLMSLSIGTPPSPFEAILDTGSDLIWTQCKPCRQCFEQKSPIFDPEKSSSFSRLPCGHKLCAALPMSSCGHGCEYTYAYGDYSTTQGAMASETFTFDDKVSVRNVAFGCGDDNEGTGFSQGAGLVGLGRGPLSLVSQLTEPKFSYCLTAIDDGDSSAKSTLLMGSLAGIKAENSGNTVTTALVKNPLQPSFYYITLKGITVGGTRLPVSESAFKLNSDGTGGMIIDSGTTITYLEGKAFEAVKKEFANQVNLPVDTSGSTGLDLCFTLPADAEDITVPKLIFHFDGDNADLDLPGENYIIADKSSGVACLAMGSSEAMSIFGNVQQQNILVVHDLSKETLSFVPTQCDQL